MDKHIHYWVVEPLVGGAHAVASCACGATKQLATSMRTYYLDRDPGFKAPMRKLNEVLFLRAWPMANRGSRRPSAP